MDNNITTLVLLQRLLVAGRKRSEYLAGPSDDGSSGIAIGKTTLESHTTPNVPLRSKRKSFGLFRHFNLRRERILMIILDALREPATRKFR